MKKLLAVVVNKLPYKESSKLMHMKWYHTSTRPKEVIHTILLAVDLATVDHLCVVICLVVVY